MENTLDRIYIINTFKSSFGSASKSIDKRLRNIRLAQIFTVSFLLLCIMATLLSLVLPIFGITGFPEWGDMPVPIIFSFTFLLHQFPGLLYETEILRHLKILYSKKDYHMDSQLNKEFLELIRKFNNNKPKTGIIVLVLLFMLAGIVQLTFKNFILWDYLKVPYLLLFGYLLYEVYNNYIKLKENISETEKMLR